MDAFLSGEGMDAERTGGKATNASRKQRRRNTIFTHPNRGDAASTPHCYSARRPPTHTLTLTLTLRKTEREGSPFFI